MYTLICANCNRHFQYRNRQKKYCSKECKLAANHHKLIQRQKRKNAEYIESTCPTCHKLFTRKKTRHTDRANHCPECRGKAILKSRIEKEHISAIARVCVYCQKPIIETPEQSQPKTHFCSTKCSSKYRYATIQTKDIYEKAWINARRKLALKHMKYVDEYIDSFEYEK